VDSLTHEIAQALEIEITKGDRELEQEIRQWKKVVTSIA